MPLAPWRRNLFAITGATFIGFASFTMVMPFLPLYFQALGLSDVGAIAMWSGLSLGVTPAMTALLAPTWGRLADRFGLKLMVMRSLVSFIVLMVAMANVSAPWQVFALRAIQGFFAGYGGLALTMAADTAPPDRVASALGTVQTAQRIGPALGPVIGGTLAGLVGIRQSFYLAAVMYAVASIWLWVGYRDLRSPAARARDASAGSALTLRDMVRLENGGLLLLAVFALQFAERAFGPTLPLVVGERLGDGRAPVVVAGTLFSIIAGAGAVGNVSAAWWLRRATAREVIAGALALSVAGALAFAVASTVTSMMGAALVFGTGVGLASTVTYAVAGAVVPAAARARRFGFLTSAALLGVSISPVLAGALASVSLRAVFAGAALALAGLAACVWMRMTTTAVGEHGDPLVADDG